MAHAVISCLHANLAALEAVLADIDQLGIATITCLGDLVGYGPHPNEVVNLVRERAIPPLLLLDRLTRMDVNRLFTARSGEQFSVELAGGDIASAVRDLEGQRQQQQVVPQRKVIGIGAGVHYTLYDPGSDRIVFRSVGRQAESRGQGFA